MTTYSHKPVQHKIMNNSNGKCGEITFCLQVDKRVYALNCLYCSQICLQWDMFINHMEKVHDAELSFDYSLQPENEEAELEADYFSENCVPETETQQTISQTTSTEIITEPQLLDDPLEEHYLLKASSVQSINSSIKVEAYELSANQSMTFDDREFDKRQMETNSQKDNEFLPNETPSVSRVCDVQMYENHNDVDESNYFKVKDASIHINIKELLNCYNGKQVMAFYETHKSLNNPNRRILCDLIIDKIFEQGFIGGKDMPKICRQIVDVFPNEDVLSDQDDDDGNNGDDINDDVSVRSSSSNDNQVNDNEKFVYDKRKLTEFIIKCYKEHPILWKCNKTDSKNLLQHHEAYKNITKMINKEMHLKFKCVQIKGKINKLRSKFRNEQQIVTELMEDKLKDEDNGNDGVSFSATMETQQTSWLYDKMSFLKDHMNYERKRSKRGTKALTNEKCYLPLAKLSNEENQQLIELYRGYPCLWDVNHIGFRFKTQRQDGLHELLEIVNTQMNLNLTLDDLQKKLYYIRYAFTQEKHRQIECEKLKTEFKPRCKLHAELLFLKESVGPFKCDYCEQVFNGPDQYKIHKSSHDGSMPYTCPICKKGFMKVGNCTVHLRRHTKDFQFECKQCGKKFPTSTDLNVHSRHHTGEKPYFCDICGQSFRTWTYFDSHRRRHEKNPNHKCSICFKGFYENNKLKQHMKSHMNVRDKVCNVCGKSFTCTKYLNQHKQTHSETKKYSCKICGKNFAQYGGLSSHTKSHGTLTNRIHFNDMDDVLDSE